MKSTFPTMKKLFSCFSDVIVATVKINNTSPLNKHILKIAFLALTKINNPSVYSTTPKMLAFHEEVKLRRSILDRFPFNEFAKFFCRPRIYNKVAVYLV